MFFKPVEHSYRVAHFIASAELYMAVRHNFHDAETVFPDTFLNEFVQLNGMIDCSTGYKTGAGCNSELGNGEGMLDIGKGGSS